MTNNLNNNVSNKLIVADRFNNSIELALNCHFDKESAVRRVNRRLANYPPQKLYMHKTHKPITFFIIENGHQVYMKKSSSKLYELARRQYLELLLEILKLTGLTGAREVGRRQQLIDKLQNLISIYEKGRLDLARIVMTSAQYNWYTGNYRRKSIAAGSETAGQTHSTKLGVEVRSKSERDIGNACETLAIPYHYEEQNIFKVYPLVKKLQNQLSAGLNGWQLKGQLCDSRGSTCYWNVPPVLEWLNAPGSLWRTYNEYHGTVIIYNDFKFMLADGSVVLWEHEGLCDDFVYRNNASERVFVLIHSGAIDPQNLVYTFEQQVANPAGLNQIIFSRILSRLWF